MATPKRVHSPHKFSWEPATDNQRIFRETILDKRITIINGPAGTGKTWCSVMTALELLDLSVKNGGVSKIVVSRPLVTAGKQVGFLPGDLKEKCSPFMRSVYEVIKASDHPKTQEFLESDWHIQEEPLEFCRSLTFHDSLCFLDEAQNCSPEQIEMFMSRLGPNSRLIVSGDSNQPDVKNVDGLGHAMRLFADNDNFGKVTFTYDDIQRAGIVREVLVAYAEDRERRGQSFK